MTGITDLETRARAAVEAKPELYHYAECGLDYVYLRNGYDRRDTRHGPAIAIHEAMALHRAIARAVITRPQPLRGQEVRFLRSMLKLSQEGLAKVLRISRPTVARWEGEPDKLIDGPSDAALRMFYSLKTDGHALAQEICELLTELDELKHEISVLELRETERGWERQAA